MEHSVKYNYLMSQLTHVKDLDGNEGDNKNTKFSIVYYEGCKAPCLLRVCKGRDLTSVYAALRKIRHPNVAVVYDFVYEDGDTYIVEEYVNGRSLEEIQNEDGNFSQQRTAKIIIDVCKALEGLHGENPPIIHNDIKPANIMLCDDGNVKLFDFDISRVYKKGQNQNTTLFGTENTASPEHYGYGQSEPRTDIYCLGVTMHKMITGEYLEDEHKNVCKGQAGKIIQKCIEIDPQKRYASAHHLRKALEKLLLRKRNIIFRIIAFICVLAVLVGGVFLFGKDKKNSPSSNDETNSSSIVEQNSSFVGGSSSQTTNTESVKQEEPLANAKKMTVASSVEGELLSMVALNDGSFVYLEKISETVHIKSSNGVDNTLQISFDQSKCALIYNYYTDSLYLVAVQGEESKIFTLDKALQLNTVAVYTAARSVRSDIKCGFLSDGILYCNAFDKELIDTAQWYGVGDAGSSPSFVVNDKFYRTQFTKLEEIDINGNVIKNNKYPENCYYDYLEAGQGDIAYVKMQKGDKVYIYKYDGNDFSELICLSDYSYFTNSDYKRIAVSGTRIWMYDESVKAIKEFII